MSHEKNTDDQTALRLLEYVADAELTAEEARAELAASGIDVEADIKDALGVVAAAKKASRLAWKDVARHKAKTFREHPPRTSYAQMPRAALLALTQTRSISTHFRKFEELTDEDLRTLLLDADELEDGSDDTP